MSLLIRGATATAPSDVDIIGT